MFDELLEPVKDGEWELKNFLREHGCKVTDVSDNPRYWRKDIDFLIEENGKQWSIEVKYDYVMSKSGNIYCEWLNPRSKGGKGWLQFCKADFLFYGDARNRIFYALEVDELREYVLQNKDKLKRRSTNDGSIGYLLPLKDAPVIFKVEV